MGGGGHCVIWTCLSYYLKLTRIAECSRTSYFIEYLQPLLVIDRKPIFDKKMLPNIRPITNIWHKKVNVAKIK
jgi:hypothetical protein